MTYQEHNELQCLNPQQLQQHPLSAAFPAMSASELQELISDIQAHGQRDPIVLLDDMVVDGWHRALACGALGIDCNCITLSSNIDPIPYVISKNARRRHVTAAQLGHAIVTCRAWRGRGRVAEDKSAAAADLPVTVRQMAKEVGVSDRTIRQAKKAQQIGLGGLMREGMLSGEDVDTLAKMPEDVRAQAVEHIKAGGEAPKRNRKKDPEGADAQHMQTKVDSLEERNAQLQEQVEELKYLLRDSQDEIGRLTRITDADDQVKAALIEVTKFKEKYRTANERINGLIREKDEAVKMVKALQRKVKRLEGGGGAMVSVRSDGPEPFAQRLS